MLLKGLFTFFLVVFTCSLAFSQKDQLKSLLAELRANTAENGSLSDSGQVKIITEIARIYTQRIPDSAVHYASKAYRIALNLKYLTGQARALEQLSRAYYIKGAYDLSINASLKALNICERINDEGGRATSLNDIGLIYLAQNKAAPALEELKKAESINFKRKEKSKLAANYINISICYSELKQAAKAIDPLMKSIGLSLGINDLNLLAMAYNRLGETYTQMGDYQKAIQHYLLVIGNPKYQDEWENSFAYSGLANVYLQKKEYARAVSHAKQSLVLAKKMNAKWDIERALKVLHLSYAGMRDFDNAYKYLTEDKSYSDSLFNENKEKQVNALLLRQKSIENLDLKKRNHISRQQIKLNNLIILIISLISVFLIVLSFLVYRNYRQKSKLSKSLADMNHSKDQLFSVIGHDLRSPFASILQTLELIRNNDIDKEEMSFIMDRFFEKLSSTSAMLDNLLLWANSQQKGIHANPVRVNLPQLIEKLLTLLHLIAQEKKISILFQETRDVEVFADLDHVRIILQNLISNAIKFTAENGRIELRLEQKERHVLLFIKDSGIGMSDEKLSRLFSAGGKNISTYGTHQEKGVGLGLLLVKKFADQNKIQIAVSSQENKGTEFILRFLSANT